MVTQAELLGRLTRVAAHRPASEALPRRLCLALAELSDVDGVGMTLHHAAPNRALLLATDSTSGRLEDVQDTLREGPSLTAYRLGRPVQVSADTVEARWPLLAQMLAPTRLAEVVAVPLRPAGDTIGVVTLHRLTPGPLALGVPELQFLVDAIGVAVVGGVEHAEEKSDLWSTRDLVSQATGMVIAQLGIGSTDALAVLRAHAFANDVPVAEIAARLVDRTLDFSADGGPAGHHGDRGTPDEGTEDGAR